MDVAQIVQASAPPQNVMSAVMRSVQMNQLLPQDDMRKVMNGTAEERVAVLKALDPEKRKQVLLQVFPDGASQHARVSEGGRSGPQRAAGRVPTRGSPPQSAIAGPAESRSDEHGHSRQPRANYGAL